MSGLNNKQIALALVTISKLDVTNKSHLDTASQLMISVIPALSEKLTKNLELSSGLVTDRYIVEALTDALDEITDEVSPDFDIENDTVGDKEEDEEASDSLIQESANVNELLNKALGFLA